MRPLMLVSAVYVGYLNAFWGAFQFDDYNVIVDNPAVHSWANWLADLGGGIRPLLKLSYTLNWTSGLGLFGFHLFNVSVHAANAVLVYLLFKNFDERNSATSGHVDQQQSGALIAALLFALHPVQTEAVTYISGRSISLMAFFYLSSLLSYIYGRQANSRSLLYLVSPLLFVLAMLTKETAVSLPLALLLWEARTANRSESWPALVRRQALHWMLLVCALVVIALHQRYWELLTLSLREQDLRTVLLTQINGVTYLISRLVSFQGLNIDPDLPLLSAWTPALAGQAAFLLTLLMLALVRSRRRPWLGFGVAWLFTHLLPTNSLVLRLDVANERQLYLASCGVFFAVGMEIEALKAAWQTYARQIHVGVILLLMTLGYFSVIRNHDYRDEIALWEATARTSPHKARAHNNLGYAYAMAGRHEDAKRCYLTALRLQPDYAIARDNLALLDTTNGERSSYGTSQIRSAP